MPEPIRKAMKVEMAQPEKIKEPQEEAKEEVKKEAPKKELPLWNFPLKQRSVRAKNLAEAEKIINAKE